jgi:porin
MRSYMTSSARYLAFAVCLFGQFGIAGGSAPVFLSAVAEQPRTATDSLEVPPNDEFASPEQTSGQNESSGVVAEPPFDERNFESDVLVVPVDHLFGDWCGIRTQWEADGVTPTLTFVSDMLGNPVGGMRQGFTEADNLGFSANFDLEKRYGIEGGSFLYSMSQRSGNGLSQDYIGNTFSVQQVFGGPTFKVVDLAYKQQLMDDSVEFQIGRIAAGDDFLVSPYNYIFVQNGFCGNPVGIFLNAPGMSGYPNATWGSSLKVQSTERTYVMGGLYNGDPSIRDLDNHGLDMTMNGPLFAIAEVGYQRNQLKGENGLVGNYKFGAWFDGNEFPDLETQGLSQAQPGLVPANHEGNYGFYALFDQVLVRFSAPGEEIMRGLGVTGSIIVSPDQSISQVPYFFTAGIAARGIYSERPRDVAAVGLVYGEFSSDLREGERQARQLDPTIGIQNQETAVEWTYIFRFRNGAYFIQPDAQYIITPGGTGQIPNAFVIGTQVGVNF